LDSFLRGKSEEDDFLLIFRLITSKDVFESYYCHGLAKRLLSSKQNLDAELGIISKFKIECGTGYTSKMESMVQDVARSGSLVENARILTTGVWPIKRVDKIIWPEQMQVMILAMTELYGKKFKGRKLSWNPYYGSVEISAKFDSEYIFSVSVVQAMILLVMDGVESSSTIESLTTATGIEESEIKRHLISMTTRHKVVLKVEDKFQINPLFSANSRLVKIPLIADPTSGGVVTSEDATAVPSTVDEDRKHSVEAAIVRIMKARKKLDGNSLVSEVTSVLKGRFSPTKELVDNRLGNLIDREFLRHLIEDNIVMYYYVA
jgi:cullin 3